MNESEKAKRTWAAGLMPELWKLFMHKMAIKSFGEAGVIAGSRQVNLYGSTEEHRKVFEEAVREFFDREE